VRDGLAADIDSVGANTSLFANWDAFVDPEGQPVVYEWSVGATPGADDAMPWAAVAGATHVSVQGVGLPLGVRLYVNVRATDMAGNCSPVSSSNGIVIGAPPDASSTPPPDNGSASTVQPAMRASVERAGITWTFDQPLRCGQFVNGDWWVQGPATLVAIAPASTADGDRVRHGSMLDPDPKALTQGYDNAMFGDSRDCGYDASRNVAFAVSPQQPLRLLPGCSLVSTISQLPAGQLPQLESCAVLTCLAELPPSNSFRPPYCGTDKRCRWSADSINLDVLPRLDEVEGAPALVDLVQQFERTWLDHLAGCTSAYLHPRANMPAYGRNIADLVGQAGLALLLDLPPTKKRPLVINLVQLGIDVHGIVQNGGRFVADGGNGSGRKFPLLLGAALLHDEELLRSATDQRLPFAEDAQTFVVAETAPGVINHGHGGYGPDDVGLPEWGNRHADDPSLDQKSWTADPYRRCCSANAWCGFVLAARALGLREAWGHPALFDYVDRYMQVEERGSWMRAFSPFAERMWDKYRPTL
jgi:hypothetical protein